MVFNLDVHALSKQPWYLVSLAKVKLRMEVITLNILEVASLVATFGCDNYQKKAGEIYCRRNRSNPR